MLVGYARRGRSPDARGKMDSAAKLRRPEAATQRSLESSAMNKIERVDRILRGGCHCRSLAIAFETALDPRTLPLRACQCSFCRRHGGITTSDPGGRLVVEVGDPERLQRYRFALGITDFLVCKTCGVYVAAVMGADGRSVGVLNVNALDDPAPFARPPEPMQYGAETVEEREARRAKVWMPAEVRAGRGPSE